ncbi:MAG: hypothetical protein LBB16_00570, partial [Puniceicoccales bacterium]|nr:hypothetical protein [Puniceicoccales bacterium]
VKIQINALCQGEYLERNLLCDWDLSTLKFEVLFFTFFTRKFINYLQFLLTGRGGWLRSTAWNGAGIEELEFLRL